MGQCSHSMHSWHRFCTPRSKQWRGFLRFLHVDASLRGNDRWQNGSMEKFSTKFKRCSNRLRLSMPRVQCFVSMFPATLCTFLGLALWRKSCEEDSMWVIFLVNCLRKGPLIGERCFCYIFICSMRSVGIKKSIKLITRENDRE